MGERIPTGVPQFSLIVESEYRTGSSSGRTPFLEEVFPCDCRFSENTKDPEVQACGERSNCINRSLSIECNPEDCICRDNCRNQRFQNHQYADVEIFETPGKGFGLRARSDIEHGTFIIEYVGEVLNQRQFDDRARLYTEQGQKHYYFMTLQNDQVIDATQKGNLSRFMNHSCNPNCATQKWIVRGRLRIGLFSVCEIKAGTELTFDYKFIRFGAKAQNCLCGEINCKGVIGEEQKGGKAALKTASYEEDDLDYALTRFTGEMGVEDIGDLTLLAKVLLRMEERESILLLLRTLNITNDIPLLRRFVSLHGVQILSVLMGLHWRETRLLKESVSILYKLPIPNRNFVEDTSIEDKIQRLSHRKDLDETDRQQCEKLLEKWKILDKVFRIPKIELVPDGEGHNHYQHELFTKTDSTDIAVAAAGGYSLTSNDQFTKKPRWNSTGIERTSKEYGQRSDRSTNYRLDYERETRKYNRLEPHIERRKERTTELPEGWKVAYTQDNQPYYYNERTRETQWNPPKWSKAEELTDEKESKLNEIIERAKKAALARLSPLQIATSGAHPQAKSSALPPNHSLKGLYTPLDMSKEKPKQKDWLKLEGLFRDAVSQVVVKYLSRWCRNQIDSPAEFKELARKLTHGIVDKEFRSLRDRQSTSPSADFWSEFGSIELSKNKRAKVKIFLVKYLRDHGFRISEWEDSAASDGVTSAPA